MNKFYIVFASVLFSMQAFAQCTNLFFSEYVEGSSNNKALEIYNHNAVPVNMAGYKVILYTNGSATPTNTFNLSGTVAAGDVYVLVHASAGDSLKSKADTLLNGSAVNFNGNDAIALLSGTDTLDIIGQIGFDPGNNQGWTVDTVANATYNRTLVRVATVNSGTKNWTLSATQWRVFKQDTSYLGSHTMLPCNPITDTLARFSHTSALVRESSGTYTLNVK
jgi:predicted extracellular nuclease